MKLKQFYNIATKVSSRKSATTFGDLPDCNWPYETIDVIIIHSNLNHVNERVPVHQLLWRFRHRLLAHWGRDKMAYIFQTTFSNASSMKMH